MALRSWVARNSALSALRSLVARKSALAVLRSSAPDNLAALPFDFRMQVLGTQAAPLAAERLVLHRSAVLPFALRYQRRSDPLAARALRAPVRQLARKQAQRNQGSSLLNYQSEAEPPLAPLPPAQWLRQV